MRSPKRDGLQPPLREVPQPYNLKRTSGQAPAAGQRPALQVEDQMDGMSIGEVGRRAGLEPSAIRYYEGLGLLPKPPRAGG